MKPPSPGLPALPDEWEVEAADPEVGFLSDTITHTCAANLAADTFDVLAAEVEDVQRWDLPGRETVREQPTYRCPACGAATTTADDYPAWMFAEPDLTDEGDER